MENEKYDILQDLNTSQREAVTCLFGPSLIVAGAGSGKTKVLTTKIANILSHGFAPYTIMALTFTNKAANQMKERIGNLVGERLAQRLYAGTFHSVFLRFLRQYGEVIGFPKNFTVYNKDDSKSLIKRCIKELELDDKIYKPNEISSRISECKNNIITAQTYNSYIELVESDKRTKRGRLQEVYALYSKKCAEQLVMDFDDILLNTYRLFIQHPDVFEQICQRFQFVLVDEYQDTNKLQYLILKALVAHHRNITVVGDDAQSIYAFRGARIENILNFQKDYPDANVFRLERNYRSTQNIVDAANSLIQKNKNQISKKCFSQREPGKKIEIISAYTDKEEAYMVASSISQIMSSEKVNYDSFAILYRTNSQSRIIEEALRTRNMPFKIYAGYSFYERAEIMNMLAYLRLILNEKDDEAFKRVVNFPTRGIGATSMERIIALASKKQLSISECVRELGNEEIGVRSTTLLKVKQFVSTMDNLRERVYDLDAYEIVKMMDAQFGITQMLKEDTSLDGQTRLDNIQEFFNSIKSFVEEGVTELIEEDAESDESYLPMVTLDLYLQNVALISSVDIVQANSEVNKPLDQKKEEDKNRISLMTIHSAKGLEFPYVYVVGMEENIFPSGGLYNLSFKEIEEERRLFYVALTRAEECVKLSFARQRLQYGSYQNNPPSRFIKEIDKKFYKNPEVVFSSNEPFGSTYSNFGPVGIGRQGGFMRNPIKLKPNHATISRPSFNSTPSPEPKRANFVPDSPVDMKVGQRVEHDRFGFGVIKSISGEAQSKKAVVEFENLGEKTLMLKFAKMKILT